MISYFRLWRLLDRRGYSKRDIIKLAGISESTFRKLISNEAVRMDVLPIKQTNSNNNMHSTIGTYFGLNRSIAFVFSALTGVTEDHFTLNRAANLCENCHGLGFVSVLDENRIIDYDVPLSQNPFRCWNRFKDFYKQIIVAEGCAENPAVLF